nr:DUF2723 domain-containing protein [Deltaproteobacteria bacterium]
MSDAPPPAEPSALAHDYAPLLAFAIPALVGALAGGNSMGFYDAPELASCAAGLGATHPPGHPLFVAVASVATLVPIGTVALRVTLLGALCLGLMGRLAYALTLPLATTVLDGPSPVAARRWLPWLALGHALGATLGIALVRQTSRAEVYALAGLLAAMTAFISAAPNGWSKATRARLGVLTLALGGANHHFIALTAAPVALLSLVDRVREGGVRALPRIVLPWAALGALGLLPYSLLGLRARAAASIVRVRTPGDLVWTVSARAFQKNTGGGVPGSFREHLLDVIDWLGRSLTPLGLIAAAAGIFIASRRNVPWARRLGLVALVGVLARAGLGFVADNPDAAGYLVPAVFCLGVLGAAFTAQAWRSIEDAPPPPQGPSTNGRRLLRAALVVAPALMFIPAGGFSLEGDPRRPGRRHRGDDRGGPRRRARARGDPRVCAGDGLPASVCAARRRGAARRDGDPRALRPVARDDQHPPRPRRGAAAGGARLPLPRLASHGRAPRPRHAPPGARRARPAQPPRHRPLRPPPRNLRGGPHGAHHPHRGARHGARAPRPHRAAARGPREHPRRRPRAPHRGVHPLARLPRRPLLRRPRRPQRGPLGGGHRASHRPQREGARRARGGARRAGRGPRRRGPLRGAGARPRVTSDRRFHRGRRETILRPV